MLSSQKTGLLQAFLGSLPEHLASRLTKAVEVDRLSEGATLPHDVILEGLRPVLRRGEVLERTPTPLRLFCCPFEDILTSSPRTAKRKGRIARSSINPVWNWVSTTLIPRGAHAYSNEIRSLVVARKVDEAKTRAIAFWNEAAAAMREALATEQGRKLARSALNGSLAVADADEMALLLDVGGEILDLQEKLPRPVPSFTEDLVSLARDACVRLVEVRPDAAPYVAVITMNRLARPWEALRLPLLFSRDARETLIASTDMGLVGEILFGDLDALSHAIRAARHPNFDGDELLANVANFAELSTAVVKEISLRRQGKWGQALLKDRAEVGSVMDAFMKRAPKEIANALPVRKASSTASIRYPDFGRPVDPEVIERALRYAALLAGCRPFAAAASFGATRKDAHDEAAEYLRHYSDATVEELRSTVCPHRETARERLALAIELTSILCGEEEADLLRRRGRAVHAIAA